MKYQFIRTHGSEIAIPWDSYHNIWSKDQTISMETLVLCHGFHGNHCST